MWCTLTTTGRPTRRVCKPYFLRKLRSSNVCSKGMIEIDSTEINCFSITIQHCLTCMVVAIECIPVSHDVINMQHEHYKKGGGHGKSIPAAWCVAFRQTRKPLRCFYSHFPHCQVSQKAVLIFVNEMLSWLIEWFYWPAYRWHWVWRCHIVVPSQITSNPTGTKKKPGTRYVANCAESIRVGTTGKGAIVTSLLQVFQAVLEVCI